MSADLVCAHAPWVPNRPAGDPAPGPAKSVSTRRVDALLFAEPEDGGAISKAIERARAHLRTTPDCLGRYGGTIVVPAGTVITDAERKRWAREGITVEVEAGEGE